LDASYNEGEELEESIQSMIAGYKKLEEPIHSNGMQTEVNTFKPMDRKVAREMVRSALTKSKTLHPENEKAIKIVKELGVDMSEDNCKQWRREITQLYRDEIDMYTKTKSLTENKIRVTLDAAGVDDAGADEMIMSELNSARKEKEEALKLIASMKADITRKEEEIEKKEQEIKLRDTDIANKDRQLKAALDGITERDKEIAKTNKQLDQLKSNKRILNPATTDDEGGEPATKRTRTEDATKSKILSVQLDYEHTHCSICPSKFSTDTDNKDENIRKHLPVLSSSKTCDHYFCHGCILEQQAAIAEEKRIEAPKWIACMKCRTKTAFCPSEPKYHRLLIDILKKAKWVDAPSTTVKEEQDA